MQASLAKRKSVQIDPSARLNQTVFVYMKDLYIYIILSEFSHRKACEAMDQKI